MYTKIEPNNKPQSTNIMDSCEILSKDLEKKLILKRNSHDFEMMSPSEEEIMRCLRTSKARLESIDSVLGLDGSCGGDATTMDAHQQPSTAKGRRLTLTITDLPLRPALLPIAEPNNLLDSPTTEVHISPVPNVSSRLLLEENVVEIPEDRFLSSSRRQSAQSCLSDYQSSEGGGVVRFVRTPSVVVSDYSDDTTTMCGISQEEIEYFRAQRLRRRFSMDTSGSKKDESTSDVSASSSCSNLYYCESKINPLVLDKADCYVNKTGTQIDHKITESSTSTCQI